MPRSIVSNISITEPMTLEDLRWLVNQTIGYPPDSKVTVVAHKEYNQMDWDAAKITVSADLKSADTEAEE